VKRKKVEAESSGWNLDSGWVTESGAWGLGQLKVGVFDGSIRRAVAHEVLAKMGDWERYGCTLLHGECTGAREQREDHINENSLLWSWVLSVALCLASLCWKQAMLPPRV